MRRLTITLLTLLMSMGALTKDLDPAAYQASIDFKMRADLADVYDRCSTLFTAVYGHVSGNPESFWASRPAASFLETSKQYALRSLKIKEKIGWDGANIDENMKSVMYYKDTLVLAESSEHVLLFLADEISACRRAVEIDLNE